MGKTNNPGAIIAKLLDTETPITYRRISQEPGAGRLGRQFNRSGSEERYWRMHGRSSLVQYLGKNRFEIVSPFLKERPSPRRRRQLQHTDTIYAVVDSWLVGDRIRDRVVIDDRPMDIDAVLLPPEDSAFSLLQTYTASGRTSDLIAWLIHLGSDTIEAPPRGGHRITPQRQCWWQTGEDGMLELDCIFRAYHDDIHPRFGQTWSLQVWASRDTAYLYAWGPYGWSGTRLSLDDWDRIITGVTTMLGLDDDPETSFTAVHAISRYAGLLRRSRCGHFRETYPGEFGARSPVPEYPPEELDFW